MDPSLALADANLAGALYGDLGNAAAATGAANAANITAAGDTSEANLYDEASGIAANNAQTELLSGQLQQFQSTRNLMSTLGAQKAGYSAAGFQDTGTTLSVARSSLQQGLLQNQILGENANIAAGGYLESAAASAATGAAASTASAAANANAAADTSVAGIDTAAATAAKGFLNSIPGGNAITNGGNPTNLWVPSIINGGVHII